MQAEKIAVVGATGRVGRHVVDVVAEAGHEPVALSRATGVDVVTGAGLDAALAGASVIIDVATGPSPDEQEATAFFTAAARNLQDAGARAGVERLVVVSIIGIDSLAGGYSVAKRRHEQASLAGPVPARVLRAAQFHEFVPVLMQWGRRGDTIVVPEMRTQIVAARSVAEALVELALADSAPERSEVAGPRVERLVELARLYAARTGETAPVQESSDASDPDRELNASGALLPGPGAKLAGPTFEQWLTTL